MKRYLLFSGAEYDAIGGGHDLQSAHDTIAEAVEAGRATVDAWWHVFDVELLSVIFRGDRARRDTFGNLPREERESFW